MKLKDTIAVSAFALLLSQPLPPLIGAMIPDAEALPFGHGGGTAGAAPPADLMAACVATKPVNTWFDTSQCPGVGANTTVSTVQWSCSTSPCGGGLPSDAQTASFLFPHGPNSIMRTWSAGHFMSNTDLFITWGGGHDDYYGNEIYTFTMSTAQWARTTVPNPVTTSSPHCPNGIAGQPPSTHTYGSTAADTTRNNFQAVGSTGSELGCAVNAMYVINPNTQNPLNYGTWTQKDTAPFPLGFGGVSEYSAAHDKTYAMACGTCNGFSSQIGLQIFDPTASPGHQWNILNSGVAENENSNMGAAINPVTDNLVAVGNHGDSPHTIDVVNLTTGALTPHSGASGDNTCPAISGPAVIWLPDDSTLALWCGGTAVYSYNDTTNVAAAMTLSGSNTVTPTCSDPYDPGNGVGCPTSTSAQAAGTYHRAWYSSTYKVLCVVNTTTDPVFCKRLH